MATVLMFFILQLIEHAKGADLRIRTIAGNGNDGIDVYSIPSASIEGFLSRQCW